jgi:hypothetical protein
MRLLTGGKVLSMTTTCSRSIFLSSNPPCLEDSSPWRAPETMTRASAPSEGGKEGSARRSVEAVGESTHPERAFPGSSES